MAETDERDAQTAASVRRVVTATLVVSAEGWDDEQIATAVAEDLRTAGWPVASVSLIDPDAEAGE